MNLREARIRFTKLLPLLFAKAEELGFEIALGKDGEKHMENSLHFSGLANDPVLYKDGDWKKNTEDYQKLGEYWESLDPNCKWGGRWEDGNHFSYAPIEVVGNRK